MDEKQSPQMSVGGVSVCSLENQGVVRPPVKVDCVAPCLESGHHHGHNHR